MAKSCILYIINELQPPNGDASLPANITGLAEVIWLNEGLSLLLGQHYTDAGVTAFGIGPRILDVHPETRVLREKVADLLARRLSCPWSQGWKSPA